MGEGPTRETLDRLVHELDLVDAAFLLGRRENPFPLLRRADCFVLSSIYEGQPMVLLEALTLGKPIVCTDFPTAREILEGLGAHIVDNSEQGLLAGMDDFIRGRVNQPSFDHEEYNRASLSTFSAVAVGEKPSSPGNN